MTVKSDDVGQPTARDLLEEVGGSKHALHTVVGQDRTKGGSLIIICVCGSSFTAPASKRNKAALRNVPVGAPS